MHSKAGPAGFIITFLPSYLNKSKIPVDALQTQVIAQLDQNDVSVKLFAYMYNVCLNSIIKWTYRAMQKFKSLIN